MRKNTHLDDLPSADSMRPTSVEQADRLKAAHAELLEAMENIADNPSPAYILRQIARAAIWKARSAS